MLGDGLRGDSQNPLIHCMSLAGGVRFPGLAAIRPDLRHGSVLDARGQRVAVAGEQRPHPRVVARPAIGGRQADTVSAR